MLARSRSVLQEQTVEVMEAVVWRSVAVHAGGGKAGSRAAQRMQNEGLRRRSWRQRPAWRSWRRPTWKGRHGGPGGGSSSKGPGGSQPRWPGDGRGPGGNGGPGGGGQPGEVMEAVVWRSVAVVWRCSP
ncbi:heterogeneous nuclear ribonucleoprotein 87F-like [Gadus chalcogrammus]|uniref:heterogeneous nuclear ribonucleoprotein 87F-like n=1 Tax=Gadus chalcogrammus TaxID=1042646 RepID=UPI0024C422AD|nr:heterogeneous nuclear ribonucleoprotein 87F-like [Gadus chalcogrammus]